MDVPEYDLPEEAIAQTPAEPRDSARLLDALDPSGPVVHRAVRDLPQLVGPGDVVVVNDSKVIPARLRLVKTTGGSAEVLLLEPEPAASTGGAAGGWMAWTALVRPGRRLPPGTALWPEGEEPAASDPVVEVGERIDDEGRRVVRFLADPEQVMDRCGRLALPPYIHRPLDRPERYQTVYAERPGSVAAPTAGLHLTPEVLAGVEERGATVRRVDLQVGLGTFRPVSAEKAEDHVMHRERYSVPPATWEACRRAPRVIAVGTTTVRALESAGITGRLDGSSDLFIRPGFNFSVVDVLLTNYHLPRSTLLLLLEAFAGPRWRDLYATALAAGYRFLSFGDAMIVGRA